MTTGFADTFTKNQMALQGIDNDYNRKYEVLNAERAKHAAALAVTKGKLAQLREEYLYARLAVWAEVKADAEVVATGGSE